MLSYHILEYFSTCYILLPSRELSHLGKGKINFEHALDAERVPSHVVIDPSKIKGESESKGYPDSNPKPLSQTQFTIIYS